LSADQFNDFFSSISERVLDGLPEGNVSTLDNFALTLRAFHGLRQSDF